MKKQTESKEKIVAPKTLRGVVVSTKMKDTVNVLVTRYVKHPKYKKYRTLSKKYLAHNPGNTLHEGDKVTIRECRPLSKNKHFEVVETI
ncbi:MAG: 30S ribosomal protein S17 [Patescibacteria group bacterium]